MPGKFFEEFAEGQEFITPPRTVTETDVVMFAALTGDCNQLHTNEEYMKTSAFGGRIAHGLLGLAIAHGLLFRAGLFDETVLAFLEVESWKFAAPVFFGDTIHVRAKVEEARPSRSKPDRGVVKLSMNVVNQRGEVVQSGIKTLMFRRRPAG